MLSESVCAKKKKHLKNTSLKEINKIILNYPSIKAKEEEEEITNTTKSNCYKEWYNEVCFKKITINKILDNLISNHHRRHHNY